MALSITVSAEPCAAFRGEEPAWFRGDRTRRREGSSETMSVDIQKIKDQVLKYSDQLERVKAEVRKVLVGQDVMLSRLLDRAA